MSQIAPAADTPVRLRAFRAETGFAIPKAPRRLCQVLGRAGAREAWWQEALRWSAISLSASLVAGEMLLWLAAR